MGRPEWIVVAVVLSAGLVGVTAAAGPGATGSGDAARAPGTAATVDHAAQAEQLELGAQQEFERSTFRVRVQEDGDAVWRFRYERPIESAEERSAYRRYAERFRTNETDLYRDFRNQSRELTAAASAETGRSMTAENVTRGAGIAQTPTQEEGYVELSFEWTNFGRVEDGTVVVGDVFEGGLYLGETQSLIFVAGDGVEFRSVDPEGSPSGADVEASDSVTWTGVHRFADRHPRAVFAIEGVGGGEAGASMLWLVGGGVIGLLLVAALAVTRYGVFDGRGSLGAETTTADPSVGAPATGTPEADPTDDATQHTPAPPDPISDERRVQQLLEDSDGRMKQTAIVEETEWSKSKVSMLLSEMEAEDTIRKIQVGRENIIALDGHEPEAASSPFDDAE